MRRVWVTVLIAACGGGTPPPASPKVISAPSPKAPPRPACITPPDEAAAISHATGDETRVQYCLGTAIDQCFALELATGALSRLPGPPQGQADEVRVEITTPDLKVCTGTSCKSLTAQVWPGAAPLHAASNGAIAVVLLGDAEAGKGYADVWDVAKSKRLATIKYPRGDFKCGEVAVLGETVYIGANACAAPSGRGALYAAKGKKIANVGGKEFGTFGNAHVQVDATTWAFLDENGTRLAIQDVVKGKVLRTIDVAELFRVGDAKEPIGNPGESALVRLAPGKLAVIAGTPANGSAAVVDVAAGTVKVVRAPLCR